jgi:hypothetical protein
MTAEKISEQLISRERAGWEALKNGRGKEFYAGCLSGDAMMVLPFGVYDRPASIQAIDDEHPWAGYEHFEYRTVELGEDAAVLSYRVRAERPELDSPYQALVSSVYVRREGEWLLAFHQQTPFLSTSNTFLSGEQDFAQTSGLARPSPPTANGLT